MKGVDREVIDALTPDKSSEYTSAKKVAQKKLRFISRLPDSEAKLRIKEALLRRGFSWDTISRVIDEME
jgi:SOS response regulatory protein OraA/RecX